jgi:hypothetical protein
MWILQIAFARMRARPLLIAVLALALVGTLSFTRSLAATRSVNPADVAATHAYLEATLTYEQTVAADAGASKAAFASAASAIGAECPGVLVNMPVQKRGLFPEGAPAPLPTARATGEANRRERQLEELEFELGQALRLASEQASRQATVTFVGAVASLSWSNPRITAFVRKTAAELTQMMGLAPPPVCADMHAWVASGYRTLSAGTKQSLGSRGELAGGVLALVELERSLNAYEGPAEKVLIREILQVAKKSLGSGREEFSTRSALARTLGIPSSPFEALITLKVHRVVLGHGKTATGERYSVTAIERSGSPVNAGRTSQCGVNVEIETHRGNGISFTSGSSAGGCAPPSSQPETSVDCNEGVLTIHASTLPRTRSVTLRLSNGHTIASRPVLLPRARGGPGGIYYQAVRGPSPIPVSLTELDAHGHRLRSERLARVVECTKPALRYLPGGLRTLVHAAVPEGGPAFSIVAQHYRFLGRTYFEVNLRVGPLGGEREGSFGFGGGSEESGTVISYSPGSRHKPNPFSLREQKGCQPHSYAIVYGMLKPPGATVTATVDGKALRLRRVHIPANMHAGGALLYAVLPTLPEEVAVRSAHGKTIFTEDLGAVGREATETCEGEAEG